MNTQKVIVYRSQVEMQQDQFISDHPVAVLVFVSVLVVIILLKWIRK